MLRPDGTELGAGGRLLRKDGPGNGANLLLGVPGVVKKGGRPKALPPDSLAGDENGTGGELAWAVAQEAVAHVDFFHAATK